MKKIALFLVCVLVFALAACGSGQPVSSDQVESASVAGESAVQQPLKIYLVAGDGFDYDIVQMDAACEKVVREIGAEKIDYAWYNSNGVKCWDTRELINEAVTNGADAILLPYESPATVGTAVQAAVDKGVTVVYIGGDPTPAAPAIAVYSCPITAGETAGEEMKKALAAKGITSGAIGIVSMDDSSTFLGNHEVGFRNAFEGTDFEILDTKYMYDIAYEGTPTDPKDIAAGFITQGVVGVFGTGENCTVGIGVAIQEDGNRAVGVGLVGNFSYSISSIFDEIDKRELIEAGSLHSVILFDYGKMAQEAMKAVYAYLAEGAELKNNKNIETIVVNQDNIAEFE